MRIGLKGIYESVENALLEFNTREISPATFTAIITLYPTPGSSLGYSPVSV
jgi:hypothetical protein